MGQDSVVRVVLAKMKHSHLVQRLRGLRPRAFTSVSSDVGVGGVVVDTSMDWVDAASAGLADEAPKDRVA